MPARASPALLHSLAPLVFPEDEEGEGEEEREDGEKRTLTH